MPSARNRELTAEDFDGDVKPMTPKEIAAQYAAGFEQRNAELEARIYAAAAALKKKPG